MTPFNLEAAAIKDATTRRGIAGAFKAAKKELWNGKGQKKTNALYICYALSRSRNQFTWQAKAVVANRLGDCSALEIWLVMHGVPSSEMNDKSIQAHRHAWLDLLIEEFSK